MTHYKINGQVRNAIPTIEDTENLPDFLLSVHEVAAQLGCGRSTVWRYASEGIIPKPLKFGGSARWRQSWIIDAINKADTAREAA